MTYHMLLVDDEIHAIEGVKSDLDLKKLNISKLFTAFSMQQAKQIFDEELIDIMVCDIEMPQGSGLELLAWVRERHPNTATIFLTSHADFKYAKEALKLGSIDYLLKPVLAGDLENAIAKAKSVIDRNSEIDRNTKSHQLWMKHHSLIIERFWLDLIHHSIPSHTAAIFEQVERHNIPITDQSTFLPILISVKRWHKTLKRRDEKILEYALRNSAEEIVIGDNGNGICLQVDRGVLLVIFAATRGYHWDISKLEDSIKRYIDSCSRYFYCDLSCYFGPSCEAQEVADLVQDLRARDRNNVAFVNQVHVYHESWTEDHPVDIPMLSGVSSLLKAGTKQAVIHEVEKLLGDLVDSQEMNADILHRFNQDFIQVLYSFLSARGVQAHHLFGDEDSRRISETAGRSVTDTLAWVRHAVNKAVNQAEAVKETDTVVETVKRYVALNLDQDLSREMIADQVFLNPDYLSRIFKKETGYSISDYILAERIRVSKELLSQTNTPISSIAISVGYTNFSHFTKIFKKYAGIGPTEYRSQHGDTK